MKTKINLVEKKESMLFDLCARFPEGSWLDGQDLGHGDCVVSGEGCYITTTGKYGRNYQVAAFDYNSAVHDPEEKEYVMGVHRELGDFVEERGWFWQCIDPGTYALYKI